MRRQTAIVAALLAAFLLPALPAVAQEKAIDFSRAGRDEAYRDLPGVVTPEELEASRKPVVCVRKYNDRPFNDNWRLGRNMVYSCTYGDVTVETNQLPYSREREMRGIGW